jgi:hypothetical protein
MRINTIHDAEDMDINTIVSSLETLRPHEQDTVKRILWQPEMARSTLGRWYWVLNRTEKMVVIHKGEGDAPPHKQVQ